MSTGAIIGIVIVVIVVVAAVVVASAELRRARLRRQFGPEYDRLAQQLGSRRKADAELTAVFGLCGLVSGSLWARKSWGVWWEWDARLTMALMLELIFWGYLLVRRFGGRVILQDVSFTVAPGQAFGIAAANFRVIDDNDKVCERVR